MSTGMILLTVLVALFLVVIVLPIVAGGICGSAICLRNVLRKMLATHKEAANTEKEYVQKPNLSYLK